MTNVDYAVAPSNASQEYFSNISSVLGAERQTKTNRERGGVIRKRHQGVRSEARTGAPVGARITPSLCCTCAGERRLPSQPASQPSTKEPSGALPTQLKKYQTFNLRTHTRFCYREKVVLPACASSSPGAVLPHPRLVEPQAPLHAHHTERKTKTYVFEVG